MILKTPRAKFVLAEQLVSEKNYFSHLLKNKVLLFNVKLDL